VTEDFLARLQTALGTAYAIERELGGGGMSRVFVAREIALGREVVLKVISPELSSSVNRDRFRREIQYAAQLQHPHIVPLLTAGENDDLLWYTMPRITGESLRDVLDRRGALPVREVLQILSDVVDALGSAHARGLVHRDIKPENILIQGSHALVTDFGVAKAISAALPGSGATAVGVAIGTPAYMAPEQVAGDPAADHRIDLYALGLLAYELLTGETPFRGNSPHQTMAAHLIRQVTPPDTLRADLPAGLSAVVMRCLQKDPADRYPDAAALLQDLQSVDASSGGHAAPVAPARRERRPLSHSARYAILGTALVAAVALIVVLAMDRVTVVVGSPSRDDSALAQPAGANGAVPSVLTLADSIAIAEAVERRLEDQQAASAVTRTMLDSIRREITLAVTDSVRRAEPNPDNRWTMVSPPARTPATREGQGRGAVAPGSATSASDFRFEADTGFSNVLMLSMDDARLASITSGGHRVVMDSLASVLDHLPGVQRAVLPKLDSLIRRGEAIERAVESTDSRFVVTVIPSRRRDSVSYTILVQDREARVRPVRTVRTPFAPLAQAGEVMTAEVAEQVRRTIEEMKVVPRPPAPGRPRGEQQ
jgi:eukaryotic-like serine/threonine-protein kinase